MRAALAVCLLIVASCTSTVDRPSPSSSPSQGPVLASGGVLEYPVPDPISPGASCFGCGQASLGGIAAGADGNLWFANGGQYKVGRMTPSGAVTQFDLPAIVGGPSGITAGPDGNIWITTNALFEGRQDWIVRLGRDGTVTQFQAGTGTGNSGTGPQRITSGPDGNLWFTEFWTNRIGRMTRTGVLTEFPIPTFDSGPRGIVAGPDGNLWFVESNFSRTAVARITTAGVVTEYSLGGSVDDQLQPAEIVAGQDGNLWLNQNHPSAPQGEIVRVTPTGSLQTYALPKGARPSGMARGPDGNIWFTDWGGNTIGRMTPSGAVRQFQLPRRNSQPQGITVGPDGRMWFTEGSRIGSIGTTVPEASLNLRVVTLAPGSAGSRTVMVTNTGDADLAIGAIGLGGSGQGAFSVISDDCSRHRVAVHSSCHINVAFTAGSDPGMHAARLTITDNATGSPQSVSLVAQLPDCKLPVFTSTPSKTQGGFLSLRDGAVIDDPSGGFVAEGDLSRSQAAPILSGHLPASYDRPAGRWVPALDRATSADGSRYAYIEYLQPGQSNLHVVDVATGLDRTMTLPSGPWGLIGWTTDGIYIHASYEGIGPGLWLVNPDSGHVRKIFSDSVVHVVSGRVAWIAARNNADPLPEPPGIGGSTNEIQSRDLNTLVTTTWMYRSGSDLYVTGAGNGSIVVSGRDQTSSYLWVLSDPGQAQAVTVPDTSEAVPSTSAMVADANGWWVGSLDGLYLWTARTGAILVSESPAAPAGTCA